MTGMIYKFKGEKDTSIKAQIVGERLEEIAKKHNRLTAYEVVADAEKENSPLREYFDWDDKIAAEKHRLNQARLLINRVVITKVNKKTVKPVKAFVNITTGSNETRTYVSTVQAMKSEDTRGHVIKKAFNQLNTWRETYSDLIEFSDLFPVIDEKLEQLNDIEEVA